MGATHAKRSQIFNQRTDYRAILHQLLHGLLRSLGFRNGGGSLIALDGYNLKCPNYDNIYIPFLMILRNVDNMEFKSHYHKVFAVSWWCRIPYPWMQINPPPVVPISSQRDQTNRKRQRSEWSNQALISITSPWMTDAPPADDDDGHLERKELDSMAIDHHHLRRRRRGWRRNASLIISD